MRKVYLLFLVIFLLSVTARHELASTLSIETMDGTFTDKVHIQNSDDVSTQEFDIFGAISKTKAPITTQAPPSTFGLEKDVRTDLGSIPTTPIQDFKEEKIESTGGFLQMNYNVAEQKFTELNANCGKGSTNLFGFSLTECKVNVNTVRGSYVVSGKFTDTNSQITYGMEMEAVRKPQGSTGEQNSRLCLSLSVNPNTTIELGNLFPNLKRTMVEKCKLEKLAISAANSDGCLNKIPLGFKASFLLDITNLNFGQKEFQVLQTITKSTKLAASLSMTTGQNFVPNQDSVFSLEIETVGKLKFSNEFECGAINARVSNGITKFMLKASECSLNIPGIPLMSISANIKLLGKDDFDISGELKRRIDLSSHVTGLSIQSFKVDAVKSKGVFTKFIIEGSAQVGSLKLNVTADLKNLLFVFSAGEISVKKLLESFGRKINVPDIKLKESKVILQIPHGNKKFSLKLQSGINVIVPQASTPLSLTAYALISTDGIVFSAAIKDPLKFEAIEIKKAELKLFFGSSNGFFIMGLFDFPTINFRNLNVSLEVKSQEGKMRFTAIAGILDQVDLGKITKNPSLMSGVAVADPQIKISTALEKTEDGSLESGIWLKCKIRVTPQANENIRKIIEAFAGKDSKELPLELKIADGCDAVSLATPKFKIIIPFYVNTKPLDPKKAEVTKATLSLKFEPSTVIIEARMQLSIPLPKTTDRLILVGGLGFNAAGPRLDGMLATMSPWKNAFGFDGFDIDEIGGDVGINLALGTPDRFGLRGKFVIPKGGVWQFAFGYDIATGDLAAFCSIERFGRDLIHAFLSKLKIKVSIHLLPDFEIRAVIIQVIPRKMTIAGKQYEEGFQFGGQLFINGKQLVAIHYSVSPTQGIIGKCQIADFALGPILFRGASLDLEISPSKQYFAFSGKLAVTKIFEFEVSTTLAIGVTGASIEINTSVFDLYLRLGFRKSAPPTSITGFFGVIQNNDAFGIQLRGSLKREIFESIHRALKAAMEKVKEAARNWRAKIADVKRKAREIDDQFDKALKACDSIRVTVLEVHYQKNKHKKLLKKFRKMRAQLLKKAIERKLKKEQKEYNQKEEELAYLLEVLRDPYTKMPKPHHLRKDFVDDVDEDESVTFSRHTEDTTTLDFIADAKKAFDNLGKEIRNLGADICKGAVGLGKDIMSGVMDMAVKFIDETSDILINSAMFIDKYIGDVLLAIHGVHFDVDLGTAYSNNKIAVTVDLGIADSRRNYTWELTDFKSWDASALPVLEKGVKKDPNTVTYSDTIEQCGSECEKVYKRMYEEPLKKLNGNAFVCNGETTPFWLNLLGFGLRPGTDFGCFKNRCWRACRSKISQSKCNPHSSVEFCWSKFVPNQICKHDYDCKSNALCESECLHRNLKV